jgi:hypothetical protein
MTRTTEWILVAYCVSALANCAATRGSKVLHPETTEEQAARIALLVLRVNANAKTVNGFILSRSGAIVTEDLAARALANVEKPIHCSAKKEGAIMSVDCETMSDTARRNYRQRAARRISNWEPVVQSACGGQVDHAMILLRGANGDEITVPFLALRTWFSDYYIHYQFSHLGARVTPPPGSCLVLEVERPDMTVEWVEGTALPDA